MATVGVPSTLTRTQETGTPSGFLMSDSVALYVRVSTTEQDLLGQERELRDYARSRGWTVVRVYAEKVTATGKLEREQWDKLQEATVSSTDRQFNRVLVWALDRWSRDPSFVQAIGSIEILEGRGIRFHS